MMREPEPAAVVALKLPVYVPSARWMVSPGAAEVSADFSWAAVATSTVWAAAAVGADASTPPVASVAPSRGRRSVRRIRMWG